MAIGRTEDRNTPGNPLGRRPYRDVWGPIRVTHPKAGRALRLPDIPAFTTGEVRPASRVLEYFDPPQSRRTFAGVQGFI